MKPRWLRTYSLRTSRPAWGRLPTLAVLPWTVEAGTKEQWLGPGLAATLAEALRRLPSVTILSRIDVQWVLDHLGLSTQPRRELEGAQQVGSCLGADVVLDGQVTVEEGKLRVALQLIEVLGGYSKPLPVLRGPEALLLVSGLVSQVVDRLELPVSRTTSQCLAALPTPSQAAFAACGRALQWDTSPGTLAEAQVAYRQALEFDPDYAQARKNLADLCLEAGCLDEAAAHYEKVLRDQPDLAMARNNLAVTYRRQGRLAEAIQALEAVIRLNTDRLARAYAHNNLGNVYRQQGQDQRALEQYRAALRLRPGYAMAQANLGVMARRQGAEEQARHHFEKATALGNELLAVVFAYRQLAALYAHRGEWDRAVAACREALSIRPHDARAHLALGKGLQALGQVDQALEAYRAVSTLDRRPHLCAEARLRMGTLYRSQHLLPEARREFRAVLRLQPEDKAAQQNLAELAWAQ